MNRLKPIGLDQSKRKLFTSAPALGAAELEPRIDPFGEGCLSGASSLAILFGVEAEAPLRACF